MTERLSVDIEERTPRDLSDIVLTTGLTVAGIGVYLLLGVGFVAVYIGVVLMLLALLLAARRPT